MSKTTNYSEYVFTHDATLREAFMANEFLFQAYVSTCYQIQLDQVCLAIQIGRSSPQIKDWMTQLNFNKNSETGLALIGAENPRGEMLSKQSNESLHEQFVSDLNQRGLLIGQGVGLQTNNPPGTLAHQERFCVVGPIQTQDAIAISLDRNQIGFVFIDQQGLATLHVTMMNPD